MLDPSIAKGLLVARREEIDCAEDLEKVSFNMARPFTAMTNFAAGLVPGLGPAALRATGTEIAEQTAKNIGRAGNYTMGVGALTGAGVGALAGGEGNRLGGAIQGAMIGLTPGLMIKGRANAIKGGLKQEASAVSKSGGPAAPSMNNPTSGT